MKNILRFHLYEDPSTDKFINIESEYKLTGAGV